MARVDLRKIGNRPAARTRTLARAALLSRLRKQRPVDAGRWTRDELYDDNATGVSSPSMEQIADSLWDRPMRAVTE